MAKSTRSKVKRAFRSKKRQDGIYAATESARLHRLSSKLKAVVSTDQAAEEEEEGGDVEEKMLLEGDVLDQAAAADAQVSSRDDAEGADAMDLDSGAVLTTSKVSTHGPRESRREQWRLSKGLSARPKSKGMNRQGGVAARRKSGRSHRRR